MTNANPLLETWQTPFGIAPFAGIKAEHFASAYALACTTHLDELQAIATNVDVPTFENTIAAFDKAGRLFRRVDGVFKNLTASESSIELQAVEREMAAPIAAHINAIYTNAPLFKRIDSLYQPRLTLSLSAEQIRLVERLHLDFVRAGAMLSAEAKTRYGDIMGQLAKLHTQFSQNVLRDEGEFQLLLESDADTAGLPPFVLASSRQAASERGMAWHGK